MSSCMLLLAFAFSLVKDMPYDQTIGTAGLGDLYRPDQVSESTPIVLMIHGGGWYNGSRPNTAGIAEYFARDLGFAVFNIEYRVVEDGHHWPACGNDCVTAAQYLLSDGFKSQYGFGYDKIWICGGSAGGHLALWTLVNLQPSQVAGVVAISPIGDPEPDYPTHMSRYTQLFEDGIVDFAAINPCARVTAGMAPVLITHAIDDTVVPVQSSRNFASAYAAAGNTVESFEYANDIEPNQAGHCIWRPDLTPHKLIASLEQRISNFVRANSATDPVSPDGEISSRTMKIVAVNRSLVGNVSSVDLSFGAGNGLSNRLYVAYGDTYGGDRRGDWEHSQFVATIPDDIATYRAYVPTGAKVMRFYLDVPFPGGGLGEPVKWISANGTQYIDTGIKLNGGDAIALTLRPTSSVYNQQIFGCRSSSQVGDRNISLVLTGQGKFQMDYTNTGVDHRCTSTSAAKLNTWYELTANAVVRRVVETATGTEVGKSDVECSDEFVTALNACLFALPGSQTVVANKLSGDVARLSIERNGVVLASYLPYKVDGVYGFYDRASGVFKTSAVADTAFTGADDATLTTPLTSATETIASGRPTVEASARTITACVVAKDGDREVVDVSFGPDNGCDNPFFMAYDTGDRGTDYRKWANFVKLGVVSAATNSWRVAVPSGAKRCRFFLSLPVEGEDLPVALQYVTGDGTDFFDTGLPLKGGDEIVLKVRPTTSVYKQQIFGSRALSSIGRNITVVLNGSARFQIDYTDTGTDHRCTATENATTKTWYDIVANAAIRSVAESDTGRSLGSSTVPCTDEFVTAYNAYLFGISGNTVVDNRFSGDVASLTVKRNGAYELSLCPCAVGSSVGFYDRAGGKFMAASAMAFKASDDPADENPLVSVSEAVSVNKAGMILIFR